MFGMSTPSTKAKRGSVGPATHAAVQKLVATGMTAKAAIAIVAKESGRSEGTVRQAFYVQARKTKPAKATAKPKAAAVKAKTVVRKAVAKKAPAKKVVAKKTVAKKTVAKKAPAKKSTYGSVGASTHAAVRKLIDGGSPVTAAFQTVAKQTNRSAETVKQAYYQHARKTSSGAKPTRGPGRPRRAEVATPARRGRPARKVAATPRRAAAAASSDVAGLIRQLTSTMNQLAATVSRLEGDARDGAAAKAQLSVIQQAMGRKK